MEHNKTGDQHRQEQGRVKERKQASKTNLHEPEAILPSCSDDLMFEIIRLFHAEPCGNGTFWRREKRSEQREIERERASDVVCRTESSESERIVEVKMPSNRDRDSRDSRRSPTTDFASQQAHY